MRTALLPLALSLSLAAYPASHAAAQDAALPDIGSSAATLITPDQEAKYGSYMLYHLRRQGLILDDPLIEAWLKGMGHRLGAASDTPSQSYTFFMMRERQINAFATLGGYIGVNAGLALTAESEDEVAGVLSHEIAHVSQRHVLRGVERARKDQLPIMLAMLGAVIASQQSQSRSASNATAAVVAGGSALMMQRQIDYTRSNESEADRIGIQTLHRAGYRVTAMADFFERMHRAARNNSGGYQMPEYLRTHPITTTRISESRERADRLGDADRAPSLGGSSNPLLPGRFALPEGRVWRDDVQFGWARERLRVLSADSAATALAEYNAMARATAAGTAMDDAQRYGRALAQLGAGKAREAEAGFEALLEKHPGDVWLALARAEATHSAGRSAQARERFEALLQRHPDHRALRLVYARVLNEIGDREAGSRAQAVLRPLLASSAEDPLFQRSFARASELAGDLGRAGEAYAEAAFLSGRPVDALNQLDALKKRPDVDYYQRARIEARIAAITPIVLEMERQGLDAEDQPTDRG